MGLKAINGIMLALFLVSMVTMLFNIAPTTASQPVHNIDTLEDFAIIQAAIDDADTLDGHTILVDAGTYHEHVVVDKSLTLIGENPSTTIIDGNNTGRVIQVSADNITVSGFAIRKSGGAITDGGIFVAGYSGNNISRNIVINNLYFGIRLIYSSNNTVSGNNVTSNHLCGIHFDHSCNNTLTGNNVSSNDVNGIYLGYSSNNNLTDNIVSTNTNGITLSNSSYNTVSGNNISSNYYGIRLYGSSNNKIFHNNLINNIYQVTIQSHYNAWDDGYPSGGNYWSDHACTGNPSGGSQPYVIDANNTDHYPFQDPDGWLLSSTPVGGISIPVNKLSLLAPYIGLTVLLAVAIVAVVYVKKRKRHKN